MQGMFNRKRPAAGAVGHLKKIVADGLKLSEDTTLSIAELTCHEPGCPPVETIIAVIRSSQQTIQKKTHKSINEIHKDDIYSLFTSRVLNEKY